MAPVPALAAMRVEAAAPVRAECSERVFLRPPTRSCSLARPLAAREVMKGKTCRPGVRPRQASTGESAAQVLSSTLHAQTRYWQGEQALLALPTNATRKLASVTTVSIASSWIFAFVSGRGTRPASHENLNKIDILDEYRNIVAHSVSSVKRTCKFAFRVS